MRRLLLASALCLVGFGALAQTNSGPPPAAAGQLPGTQTNDSANTGNVGQLILSQCAGPASTATVTITIATPSVVTWTGSPFVKDATGRSDVCPVVFTTTGALPTGLTAGTTYWTDPASISGNNFSVAISAANAIAGTDVATTGTQSGVQTGTAGQPLATGVLANVTAISLPAGDWDVFADPFFGGGATTTVSYLAGGVSAGAGSLPQTPLTFNEIDGFGVAIFATGFGVYGVPVGPVRVSVAANTNYFMNAQAGFVISTATAYGALRARRIR